MLNLKKLLPTILSFLSLTMLVVSLTFFDNSLAAKITTLVSIELILIANVLYMVKLIKKTETKQNNKEDRKTDKE